MTGSAVGNGTFSETIHYYHTVCLVTVIISLLGLVGNGTIIWLLGFRVKRNAFSVYILNMACANFTFLLSESILNIHYLTSYIPWYVTVLSQFMYSVHSTSFLVGLSLLMALSTEHCVSVLCPTWYRCHRPKHLSSILCALIWGLDSCLGMWEFCCFHFYIMDVKVILVRILVAFVTFLVLCVSSLTLLIQVQCRSRRRQSSRLFLTIMLSALASLLLGLPYTVWLTVCAFSLSVPCMYRLLKIITRLLLVLNSVVNPIIYFSVGRHGQPSHHLQEVLQTALNDQQEELRRREESLSLSPVGIACPPEVEGVNSAGTQSCLTDRVSH